MRLILALRPTSIRAPQPRREGWRGWFSLDLPVGALAQIPPKSLAGSDRVSHLASALSVLVCGRHLTQPPEAPSSADHPNPARLFCLPTGARGTVRLSHPSHAGPALLPGVGQR